MIQIGSYEIGAVYEECYEETAPSLAVLCLLFQDVQSTSRKKKQLRLTSIGKWKNLAEVLQNTSIPFKGDAERDRTRYLHYG